MRPSFLWTPSSEAFPLTLALTLCRAPSAAASTGCSSSNTLRDQSSTVLSCDAQCVAHCPPARQSGPDPLSPPPQVLAVFLVSTAHTAVSCHIVWYHGIEHFGDASKLADCVWSFAVDPLLTALVAAIVQAHYAWRVYLVGGRRPWMPALILVLTLLQLGACAALLPCRPQAGPSLTRLGSLLRHASTRRDGSVRHRW